MPSLYLDTTGNLLAGILADDQSNWLAWEEVAAQKTSAVIYPLLHRLLDQQNLTLAAVQNFYYVAGPGSYTGMRLAEGLAQIIRWKIPVRSFYHFQVPALLGERDGLWFCSAFKQEYFIYRWSPTNTQTSLVKEAQLGATLVQAAQSGAKIYTHFVSLLKAEVRPPTISLHSTAQLVQQHPALLGQITPTLAQGPYYFRGLDQEFRQGKVPTFKKV